MGHSFLNHISSDWNMADDAVDADENLVSRRDAIFHYVIECFYNG